MRIGLVCDWFPPRMGGLEIHLSDLARELSARGHHAEVICTIPGPDEHRGIRVHRLPVPLMPELETIRSRACMPLLARLFRERAFDVVHLHTVISPLAHAGAAVARHMGLPTVLTEHSVLRHLGVAAFRLGQLLAYPWADRIDVLSAVSRHVAEDLRWCSGRDDIIVPS
jgi:glycosyltransferase involved in cell wall biosynthesis